MTIAAGTPVPTVHLNGSNAARLIDGYVDAATKVDDAINALVLTAPHMRDYYVQPDGYFRFTAATAAHTARIAQLDAVKQQLLDLALAVREQEERRG